MRTTGLFDIQVNGFGGVDFNDAALTPKAFDQALEAMLATGVTACLPTIITATEAELQARFAALDRAVARSRLGPRMVPGYHLEGPFLNPAEGYSGCHPPGAMIPASTELMARLERSLSRPILLVTVAPERPGGEDFVRAMAAAGKVVAIGHSAVDAPGVERAAAAGARLSTHLGNGLPQQLHKLDNAVFAQLAADELSASFIADGIHLPPHALKAMLRAKGPDRAILVSDAVAAAAAPPGLYPFAGMIVEHAADGSVRVPGARSLAGSALTMDRAVRNLIEWGFAEPETALRYGSRNPRALLRPACEAHGVGLPEGRVTWSESWTVLDAKPA